jgi:hypothetical protein
LDPCVFSLFKILYKKDEKMHKLKGEMLKIYRAVLAFYKARIIPTVRWSFLRAGFHLNPENLLAPLTMTRTEVLERMVVLELSLEEFVFSTPDEAVRAAERPACRRAPILGPPGFAISVKA